ncbi:hypothetical protein WJX81_001708 [Elliptochloris bilobata]|uniref:Tyrosine-specific transport protein n=1 Tax=Elliptochloris bilobata TaxID=381761 RepID=A0AAW1SJ29_9CHLO
MQHTPGTTFGSAALVAGTTVGAGILALPYATQEAGFVASSAALVVTCAYSIVTGLLVAEVSVNSMCELGQGGVSLTSMAERTLGKPGARFAGATYLFLHYALLVAYIAKAGSIVGDAAGVPHAVAAITFAAAFSALCFWASPRVLDRVNSALVVAVVASFLALLALASGGMDSRSLARANWAAVPATLPVLSLAFVYQNVVPVIASNLEGDIRKVRTAVVAGVCVPLAMFLAWDAVILGSLGGGGGGAHTDPLAELAAGSPAVGALIQAFSLLAIATSFIGFVLGLSDFLADYLKLPAGRQQVLPYALTVGPPLALALSFPDLFFRALDIAGTYGVLVLFGVLPAAMAYSERYGDSTLTRFQVVPGGRASLVLVGALAGGVIVNQLLAAVTGS